MIGIGTGKHSAVISGAPDGGEGAPDGGAGAPDGGVLHIRGTRWRCSTYQGHPMVEVFYISGAPDGAVLQDIYSAAIVCWQNLHNTSCIYINVVFICKFSNYFCTTYITIVIILQIQVEALSTKLFPIMS